MIYPVPLEDIESCNCITWGGTYKGVSYEIVHHGFSKEYNPLGIWCYYIFIHEEHAKDFEKFYCPDVPYKITDNSPYRIKNNYENIPDMGFHGGITFYKNFQSVNSKTGEPSKVIQIGCDYAHLWDEGNLYYKSFIEQDCKNLIDKYLDNGYKIARPTKKKD